MDTTRFDEVARVFGSGMTRHEALRGLVAGAAALTAGVELLQAEDASARKWRRRMNRKKTQNQGLPPGARWSSGQQCAANHICEVLVNGSNSDTYCSGVTRAPCGPPTEDGDATAPDCAVGHQCFYNTGSSAGVCQQLPDAL